MQWCRGVDGRVDPARIVAEAKRIADFDVLCLQEIADNFPDPRLGGSDERRPVRRTRGAAARIHARFPAIAVDQPARRRQAPALRQHDPVAAAGAAGLSAVSCRIPRDPGKAGMPRIAIEAVVGAPFGDVRVITTHLEYYSRRAAHRRRSRRCAQIYAARHVDAALTDADDASVPAQLTDGQIALAHSATAVGLCEQHHAADGVD